MNVDPKSGWGIAGNVGKAVGGMAIPSATALLTGGAGAPLLGGALTAADASGGTVTDLLEQGYGYDDARSAGALTAAVEVATERLFGGVTGVGEGMIDDIGEKILGQALVDSKGMSVVKAAFDSLGEGAEEYIASQAGTLISRVYDREAAGKSWGELLSENRADALYDGLIGTLTSAVMKAPGEVNRLSESGAERRAGPGAAGSGIQNENGGVPAAITKGGIQDADVRSGFQAVNGDADRFFLRLHGIDPDTGMVIPGGMEAESWKPNAAGESAAAADDGVHASVNALNQAKNSTPDKTPTALQNSAPDSETAKFDLYRRMFGSGDTGGEVQTAAGNNAQSRAGSGIQTENGVPTAVSKGEIQNADVRSGFQTVTGDADRFFLRLHGINPDTGLEGPAKTPNAYSDAAGDDGAFRFYLRTKGIDPDTGMIPPGGMEAESWKPNAQASSAVQAVLQNSAPDKTSAVLRDSGDKRYNQGEQGSDELPSADRHKQGDGGDEIDFYVGPNGKALSAAYKNWIGTNRRTELLQNIENSKLENAIKQLYKGKSFIGDGGTADVLNFENTTRIGFGKNGGTHYLKARDMAIYIQNKVLSENLSIGDRSIAERLLKDLKNALGRQ